MNNVLTEKIKSARKNADYLKDAVWVDKGDYVISFNAVPKELKQAYIAAKIAKDEKMIPLLRNEIENLTIVAPKLPDGSIGMGMMLGPLIDIIERENDNQ